MDFAEKLNALMDLFSISNSRLAKRLSVDPSLISKWRHGNRLPARSAGYVKEVVFFFYEQYVESDALLQHRLRRILGESAELHLDDSEMALKQFLLEWLISEENGGDEEGTLPSTAQGRQVIQLMQQLMNVEASPMPQLPVTEPAPIGGALHQYHLHAGRSGRRKAVIEFLDLVLEMKPPQELLLLSQENLEWMMEDPAFLPEWNQKLTAVLASGHQVTIIHHMDRENDDLLNIMKYWIPLHLTGNVRSWYFPRYRELPFQNTYFIIRNQAAVYASVNEDTPEDQYYTFFFRDALVARILENSYQSLLKECMPLVRFYTANRLESYMDQVVKLEEEAGTWIGWKNGLTGSCMSLPLYEQLMVQEGIKSEERWRRLQLHQKRLESFRKNIPHFSYVEVLPLNLLNQLSRGTQAVLNSLESFTERPLRLKEEQVISLLESMVDRLRKYPNYEVYLANKNPLWQDLNMNLGYKENQAALAGSLGPGKERPVALLTGEGNMTQVFEGFLDTALDSIPGNFRNRQRVIAKLEKVIAYHRNRYQNSWNRG